MPGSDTYVMPKVNGVNLLGKVQAIQPDAERMHLTGFGDQGNAIREINEVGHHQYIEEPRDNEFKKCRQHAW